MSEYSALVKQLSPTFYSSTFYNISDCNLSDHDLWCYDHHSWDCAMASINLETLKQVSAIFDAATPAHQWGKWGLMADYDCWHRKCPCGEEMKISNQVLGQFIDIHDAMNHLQVAWYNVGPHNHAAEVEQMLETHFGELTPVEDIPIEPEFHTLEQVEQEPIELDNEQIQNVIDWLEKPYQDFISGSDYWELIMLRHEKWEPLKELEETGAILLPYTVILIRRLPVVFADRRWWVDMAIRTDTGEPIASVNHKGDHSQFMKEVIYAPKANPSQAD